MAEVPFRLADIGEGLTEAEVIGWKAAVGEHVEAHQPIVEVETDKARVELPAPATGTLSSIAAEAGELVQVGTVLFTITVEDGELPPPSREDGGGPDAVPTARGAAPPAAPRDRPRRVLAAPATRSLARELGVELGALEGTGPGGRITGDDVRAATSDGLLPPADNTTAPAAPSAALPERPEPLRGLQRALARSMTAAWTIPHITEFRDVDATELVRAQRALRARIQPEGVRFGFAPLLVKVAVAALESHPLLNATYDPEQEAVTRHRAINVGVATDTPEGLIVPVIHDARSRPLLDLARQIETLAEAAAGRTLSPAQLAGGSFTVTNTGAYGGQFGTPMLRPPEVAIAGFGRIRDAVVAADGQPVVRPMLPLSVSVDHRIVTGAQLGAFVTTLERLIDEPALLLVGLD